MVEFIATQNKFTETDVEVEDNSTACLKGYNV